MEVHLNDALMPGTLSRYQLDTDGKLLESEKWASDAGSTVDHHHCNVPVG